MDFKWVRSDMDLFHIEPGSKHTITISNHGDLAIAFYEYAQNFHEAGDTVIRYLIDEATKDQDKRKLGLWYFALVYLYRHSLELLLKACIFQVVTDPAGRKDIVGQIRHDLQQSFEKLIEVKGLRIDEDKNAQWVMEYLSDISNIDKESDMFRYPFGMNFKALFNEQTNISLMDTYDNIDRAYDYIKEIFDGGGGFPEWFYKSHEPRLIIEGGPDYQQILVGSSYYSKSYYPYITSYFDAGNFLKDLIITQKKNNLFMPMCYLYRNAIELELKRIIMEDRLFDSGEAIRIIQKKKHSILGLWNIVADKIKQCDDPQKGDTTTEDTHKYILSFHSFDPSSDLFRYPCDKNMKLYFSSPKSFDIENVASCFEELLNTLSAADDMLSDY